MREEHLGRWSGPVCTRVVAYTYKCSATILSRSATLRRSALSSTGFVSNHESPLVGSVCLYDSPCCILILGKLWSQIVGLLIGFSFTILGLNRDIFNVIFGGYASRSWRLRYECLALAIQPDLLKIKIKREIQDNTGDDMYENVRDHVNRQLDLSWLVSGPFLLDSTSPEFTCEPA